MEMLMVFPGNTCSLDRMYPKSESEKHLWVQVGNRPTLHISRVLNPKKLVPKQNCEFFTF